MGGVVAMATASHLCGAATASAIPGVSVLLDHLFQNVFFFHGVCVCIQVSKYCRKR